jgi:hypothetical protein
MQLATAWQDETEANYERPKRSMRNMITAVHMLNYGDEQYYFKWV